MSEVGGAAEAELVRVTHAWDRAMVTNDADAIGAFIADDWTIVGPDGSLGDRHRFLDLVRSGVLTHDVMESHDLRIRVYGDTATVLARGVSAGQYEGTPFRFFERVSSVFVRRDGEWRCVLTHLSTLEET